MHPILFHYPGGYVQTYTVLVWTGWLAGIAWACTQLKYHEAPAGDIAKLFATLIAAGLVGGKLGILIVEWHHFVSDPWLYIRHWDMGWVFWFGLLCAMLTGLVYREVYNRTHRPRAYLPIADYLISALAIGHVFGRLGCFMAGCCYGRPTSMPWGVVFTDPRSNVAVPLRGIPLHPTELYEAFGVAVGALLLIAYVLPAVRAKKLRYGTAFFGYLLYYSALRFTVEIFRGDDRGMILSSSLSPSQWISLGVGTMAALTLLWRGVIETDPASHSLFLDAQCAAAGAPPSLMSRKSTVRAMPKKDRAASRPKTSR